MKSNTGSMIGFGTEFWNDSCATGELSEAIQNGAVGATSNPVIVSQVLQTEAATWTPVIRDLVQQNKNATEDEVAWLLIEQVTKKAAALLYPVFEKTKGEKGYLSVQTNAKFYRDADRMLAQGLQLNSLAKNLAIKVPTTTAGVKAMEALAQQNVRINATVCYTVPQALAVAEALERTKTKGHYITLMVGRLDDHLKRQVDEQNIPIDTKILDLAGIAVAKKTYQIFAARKFSSRVLVAAFRDESHWRDLIGENILHTIPYAWWKKFNQAGPLERSTIAENVDKKALSELQEKLPDFRRAFDETGLQSTEFDTYGATQHTLNQFLGGYQSLVESIRKIMLS